MTHTHINNSSYTFKHTNLLGIEQLSQHDIVFLLDQSEHMLTAFRSKTPLHNLKDAVVINLFFENSTRTLNSFDIAAKKLGAEVINTAIAHSSIKKGETLLDTAATLNAMRPDIVVIRHSFAGATALLSAKISCPVINAGDGAHEHPTQALLDALTIKLSKGSITGLKVAICGDILHSRVAYSNILLLKQMQADVHVVAPPTLMPHYIETLGITAHTHMSKGIKDCDIIMMLRLQTERMNGIYVPSPKEFYRFYGLDVEKLQNAKPDALIMHPGPTNRGVEIDGSIIENSRSLIERQVESGVAVRMAVMHNLYNAMQKAG